jgi:nucleoside phosphorylase
MLNINSQPDWHLTQALGVVASNHKVGQTKFEDHVFCLQRLSDFESPSADEDRLFQATYKHEGDYFSKCIHCSADKQVQRPKHAEARPEQTFKFHFGSIASGGAVIQDGEMRDKLSRDCYNARCFEMEAVGVNLNSRCLVVRGIADYADSHKNDTWKYVAAAHAACFAKELLLTMKASGLQDLSGIVPERSKLE